MDNTGLGPARTCLARTVGALPYLVAIAPTTSGRPEAFGSEFPPGLFHWDGRAWSADYGSNDGPTLNLYTPS